MRNLLNILEAAIDATTTQEPTVRPTSTKPDMAVKQMPKQVVAPSATAKAKTPAKKEQPKVQHSAGLHYATKDELGYVIEKMNDLTPFRLELDGKPKLSPVPCIRAFGVTKEELTDFFNQYNLTPIPNTQDQQILSGKPVLSYRAGNTIYTFVATGGSVPTKIGTLDTAIKSASKSARKPITVTSKEFTPSVMNLSTTTYTRESLVSATESTVKANTKSRPALQAVLLDLIQVALGNKNTIDPELNKIIPSKTRKQLGVDFGEILAPIMLAKGNESIEFPPEGNFPLVDVTVGGKNYSVKSATGSGTSFKSIVDLMDSFEQTIASDKDQMKLFSLIKNYHPTAGGLNTDKIIAASVHAKTPEFKELVKLLHPAGIKSLNYDSLMNLVARKFNASTMSTNYEHFLKTIYPISIAGNWGEPVGMPADASKYGIEGVRSSKREAKTAGFPSFRANPIKAMTDILTYVLGVGTLNYVNRGKQAKEYAQMMTQIVSQSSAYLGKIDITSEGGLSIISKPFTELNFGFQYHAPSHIPGNNLPGFMIVLDKPEKKKKPVGEMRERQIPAFNRERR